MSFSLIKIGYQTKTIVIWKYLQFINTGTASFNKLRKQSNILRATGPIYQNLKSNFVLAKSLFNIPKTLTPGFACVFNLKLWQPTGMLLCSLNLFKIHYTSGLPWLCVKNRQIFFAELSVHEIVNMRLETHLGPVSPVTESPR